MHPCFRARAAALLLLATVVVPARAELQLRAHVDVAQHPNYTDVWGWVNPITGREYALVGHNYAGLIIVDLSDPVSPTEVARVTDVPRFDVKTYRRYAYTVDGNYGFAGADGAIVDLTDPANPQVVGHFRPGHNVTVDPRGFLYVTFPGTALYDLRQRPTDPELIWEFPDQDGHDVTVVGNRMYDFHGYWGTAIYDVTDGSAPMELGYIDDPRIAFHHSGWPSEDGKYLFLADELATDPSDDITVWYIGNPIEPKKVAGIRVADATAHNCYVIGNYLFVGFYTAGLQIYDVSLPGSPRLVDAYDTYAGSGEGVFEGAWGCYPFLPSGSILVSDRPNGLFVFQFIPTATGVRNPVAPSPRLEQNYPNPFNPLTTIVCTLPSRQRVTLEVIDATGSIVRTLADGILGPGRDEFVWDGRNALGRQLPSGVYFARLRGGSTTQTIKMVLVE